MTIEEKSNPALVTLHENGEKFARIGKIKNYYVSRIYAKESQTYALGYQRIFVYKNKVHINGS